MIGLSDEKRVEVDGFVRRRKANARNVIRAHILLKSAEGRIRERLVTFSAALHYEPGFSKTDHVTATQPLSCPVADWLQHFKNGDVHQTSRIAPSSAMLSPRWRSRCLSHGNTAWPGSTSRLCVTRQPGVSHPIQATASSCTIRSSAQRNNQEV